MSIKIGNKTYSEEDIVDSYEACSQDNNCDGCYLRDDNDVFNCSEKILLKTILNMKKELLSTKGEINKLNKLKEKLEEAEHEIKWFEVDKC